VTGVTKPPDAETDRAAALHALTKVMKLAASGELAAAFAYRGHWRSVASAEEAARIRQIEEEELHHRRLLLAMLRTLGQRPSRFAEARAWLIGKTLGALCHVSGWLLPMWGAGRLESRNVREYESAARSAHLSGHGDWVDCFLVMAEVEWEHEAYFRAKTWSHPFGTRLPRWQMPPPKAEIRRTFEAEFRSVAAALA